MYFDIYHSLAALLKKYLVRFALDFADKRLMCCKFSLYQVRLNYYGDL